jgi:acyl-CoA dehydrogenase
MSDDLLRESCARLFADLATREAMEDAERGEFPGAMWAAVEDAGLARPQVEEKRGGAGGTWLDAYTVLHEAGRHTLPLPLAETIAGAWLLAQAGIDVPAGPLTVAQAGGLSLNAGRLSGEAAAVPWGADAIYVVALAGDKVALLANGTAQAVREANLAGEPRDTLRWKDAVTLATGPLRGADAVTLMAMMRAAQMAGAIERVLELSVRHVIERSQFGRPLAANQAVQQALAVLAGHSAAATAAAEHAFHAMARGDAEFEIAAAKIRCGEAASAATNLSHQAHGAIGFTREYGLQYATRRLWAWRAESGSDAYWSERLGRRVAARGIDAFWPDLAGR